LQNTGEGEAAAPRQMDKATSLIPLNFVDAPCDLYVTATSEWVTEQSAGPPVHLQKSPEHTGTWIRASLWDREKARASVNVTTCTYTHGSPFTPPTRDKGALYLSSSKPLEETSGSPERRSTT